MRNRPLGHGMRGGQVRRQGVFRPSGRDDLIALAAGLMTAGDPGHPLRVAVDGADAAHPGAFADEVAAALPGRGRPVCRVSMRAYLRPASVRFEYGRTDADSYLDGWFDVDGLRREVLVPAGPGGSHRILTALYDPDVDRATRLPYTEIPRDAVVLVDGPMLLGQGLPFEVTVHLSLSAAALARRTAHDQAWTVPALQRWADRVEPERHADLVVRVDHPDRPALSMPGGPRPPSP